jgi:O-antigen/teichoic acid export membrane protein
LNVLDFFRRKHDTRFGLVLFSFTLVAGFAQLACMIGLQRMLEPEQFSQVSLVLTLFTSYMIFSELGLQDDLIRRISVSEQNPSALKEALSGVCSLRLIGALLGLGVAVGTIFVNNYSALLAICLLSLVLSLFPIAIFSTLESESLHTRSLAGALRIRLGKVCGLLFVLVVVFTLRPDATKVWPLTVAFIGYSAIQFSLALAVPGMQSRRLYPSLRLALVEFKSSWNLVICRVFTAMNGALFINLQIRLHSESGLAEFNMAQSILAPLSLVVQIVIGLAASRLFVQSDRRLSYPQLAMLCGGILALHLTFLWIFSCPSIIELAFPGLRAHVFFRDLVPLTLNTFSALLTSYLMLLFQHHQNRWAALIATTASILGLIGGFVWLKDAAPDHSTWMACVSQLVSIMSACALVVWMKRKEQDRSV